MMRSLVFPAILLLIALALSLVPSCATRQRQTSAAEESGASPSPVTYPVASSSGGGNTADEEEIIPGKADDGFLYEYSDYETAENRSREMIESPLPPVTFKLGQTASSDISFEKTAYPPETVTDYPESDHPVSRILQKVEYRAPKEGLLLEVTYTRYPGYPIVEYDAYITNLTDETTGVLSKLNALDADFPQKGDYTLHYNRGSGGYSATDYEPLTASLSSTRRTVRAANGMSTSAFLPYFNAESNAGGGVILAVNWQGNWFSSFSVSDGKLKISSGQDGFSSVMLPKERFKLPGTVLLFYKGGDWQTGQNVWRRWVSEHNLMRWTGRRDFTQNVYVCSDFSGPSNDLRNVAAFASSGLAKEYHCVYEFDAGWYKGSTSDWFRAAGNWSPLSRYGEGAIKKISDACHEAGLSFAMWFEPERLLSNTESAPILGENVIYTDSSGAYVKYSDELKKAGLMGLINYGKQEAQDFVVGLISGAVKEYGIDVYRQDFNTDNGGYWSAYDRYESRTCGEKRTGATENHACEGYINAWRRIEEENPGLIIDACAGGGRRYDLETMRFGFMHTKSDYWADVISQQGQNLGVSMWNLFTGTGFENASDLYDVRSRLTLSVGIGASGVDENVKNALKEWSSLQTYLFGDYYALTDYSLSGSANLAVQFCETDGEKGMLVSYMRAGGVMDLRAKGLDENARYKVWSKDEPQNFRVLTGKTFMEEGYLLISGGSSRTAFVLFYEKTDGAVTPFDRDEALSGLEIVDFSSYKTEGENEDRLLALSNGAEISENGVLYLCPDAVSYGGIYLLGASAYENLKAKTGAAGANGWAPLDGKAVGIRFPGGLSYSLSTWAPGTAFDLTGFVKEISGRHFLWLRGSFGFGDPDGGWKTDTRAIYVGDYATDDFTFHVCPVDSIGEREVQYVARDASGSGAVYVCSEELFDCFPLKKNGRTVSFYGIEWKEADGARFYLRLANDSNVHNVDNASLYTDHTGKALEENYGVRFYLGQNEKGKFLYIENGCAGSTQLLSDRAELCYIHGDTLKRTQFYLVTSHARAGVALPPPTLFEF